MQLLTYLLDIVFPPRESELLVRNAKEDELLTLYRPRTYMISKSYVTALLPYRAPLVHACITEAKFNNNKKAQAMLGAVLAKHLHILSERIEKLSYSPALVPVPLGVERRKERGYNQVEEIGKQAGSFPMITNLISRTRDTVPQTTLNGSNRRRNLKDAFSMNRTPDSTYLYIVLDDVLTTGTTLSAAGRVLAGDGIRPISLLALAH